MENRNVFDEICKFKSGQLKCVDTHVTMPSGERFVEGKSINGGFSRKNKLAQTYGFVGDVKPDLQVANVFPGVGLFLGSQDVAQDGDLLRQHGITHILNCGCGVDNYFPNEFIYKKIEMYDIPECNITKHFDNSFEFIDDAITRGKVFVHCNAGVSRAASLVIAYLMRKRRKPFREVFEIVKRARPAIRPNDGFMKQLQEYETVVLQ